LQLQTCHEHIIHSLFVAGQDSMATSSLRRAPFYMWALCLDPILICTYETHLASLEHKDVQNLWQKSGFISTFETHFARNLVFGHQNLQLLVVDQKDSN
jgi:hypothetical protein